MKQLITTLVATVALNVGVIAVGVTHDQPHTVQATR